MIRSILMFGASCLVAAAIAGVPANLLAQTTNKPPVESKSGAATGEAPKAGKKSGAGPFHGKLAGLDKTAKTITVGKRTFLITSQTKMNKGGKAAILGDGVVGEEVSGYVKPSEDGKLVATTVNFGPKGEGKSREKTKPAPENEVK